MRTSRRVRKRLVWLVQFLKVFYSQEELRSHASRLVLGPGHSPSDMRLRQAEYGFALAEALEDPSVRGVVESSALYILMGDEALRAKLPGILDLDGEDAQLKTRAEWMREMAELKQRVINAPIEWPAGVTAEGFWRLVGGHPFRSLQEKVHQIEAAFSSTSDQIVLEYSSQSRDFEKLADLFADPAEVDTLYRAISEGFMSWAGDREGAQAATHSLHCPGLLGASAFFAADGAPARELADRIRSLMSGHGLDAYLEMLGASLLLEGQRFKEAVQIFRRQVEWKPDHQWA